MENYYSSYPDSRDSSPRSREIDCENASWEEQPSNYKVKFMCSYGGKIQPRPHDNQLAYIGGDTKILAVDRTVKFNAIKSKLSSLCDADVCFKYQLPGEDLDALISATNDEDLEHMMLEYDRLYRGSAKPARLRLFLFPLNPDPSSFGSNEPKSERQWFVDALNSVQVQSIEGGSPPAAAAAAASAANPDFLFGFDKGFPAVPANKFPDSAPVPTVPDSLSKDVTAGSDCGSEDRHVVGEPVMSQVEIQRQIQELQRMQIANQEQAMFQRKSDEGNPRAYTGDYYAQRVPEKVSPAPASVPVQVPMPGTYLPERHMTTGGYQIGAGGGDHAVYLIPTQSGVYQAVRPVTQPVSQPYYGMQRMVTEGYREQPVYNAVPQGSLQVQQQKVGAYSEGIHMVQPKVGVAEPGYAQVGFDSAGRQVYYTASQGGVVPTYQTVAAVAVDGRQGGGPGGVLNQNQNQNQEGKVVAKVSQTSM